MHTCTNASLQPTYQKQNPVLQNKRLQAGMLGKASSAVDTGTASSGSTCRAEPLLRVLCFGHIYAYTYIYIWTYTCMRMIMYGNTCIYLSTHVPMYVRVRMCWPATHTCSCLPLRVLSPEDSTVTHEASGSTKRTGHI